MITIEQAREGLVKAVELKGEDYVYVGPEKNVCLYNVDGEPSCIVGHAVNFIDPELFEVLSTEEAKRVEYGKQEGSKYAEASTTIEDMYCIGIDRIARRALMDAQSTQDQGGTWGEALARFDRWVVRAEGQQ